MLVFHPGTAGHPEVGAGIPAITRSGRRAASRSPRRARPTDFNGANLARYRALVFLNTAGNRLNDEQEGALADFMEDGGGFVGIGTAAETEPGIALFDDLIGARPDPASPTGQRRGRSWSATACTRPRATCRSSSTAPTSGTAGRRGRPAPSTRSRASARSTTRAGDGTTTGGTDHPISWCRDIRGGRSFYTGMGRTADGYGEERFRTHLLGAIQWAAGLVRGNCKATINANYRGTRVVAGGPVETGLATSGESHGLTIAPNGWVIYIGRGDCRTDAERGALLGLPSLGPHPRPLRPERRHRLRQRPRVGPGPVQRDASTAA